ncbi:MAG: PKD domain-containing protein [Flavobacteriales bacterium]
MRNMKGQDAFERSLKEALEPYEVPYNSSDWAQLEKRLDEDKRSSWHSSAALFVLLLGGGLAVATTLQMLVPDPVGSGEVAVIQAPQLEIEPASVTPSALDSSADGEPVVAKDAGEGMSTADEDVAKAPSKGSHDKPSTVAVTAITGTDGPDGPEAASTAVSIRPSVTEGCPGTTIEFDVENMPRTGMHLWNFGDGSFSNKPKPSHTFSKAGKYEVMLSHSSMGGGNIQNKPASDLIVIHEAPDAAFNHLKQEYDNTVPSVHFENRSQGGHDHVWDFGDGTSSTIAHPDHVFKKKGSYTVSLTVTNENGCVDRFEQKIKIDNDYDLLAQDTFSPNGDGLEDVFIPEALKTLGVKFHLSIFDAKSGQLVYETSDHTRPWNGRIGNRGEMCATGDYMWMVEMKDGEKLGGSYNGTIGLLR